MLSLQAKDAKSVHRSGDFKNNFLFLKRVFFLSDSVF